MRLILDFSRLGTDGMPEGATWSYSYSQAPQGHPSWGWAHANAAGAARLISGKPELEEGLCAIVDELDAVAPLGAQVTLREEEEGEGTWTSWRVLPQASPGEAYRLCAITPGGIKPEDVLATGSLEKATRVLGQRIRASLAPAEAVEVDF